MKKGTLFNQKRAGFTLLELLVVISIIGILLALGVVAFTTAQRKGRDAKRRADIKSIQDGFEQYYANEGSYGAICNAMYTFNDPQIFPAGAPMDPREGAYPCSSAAAGYCVCASLEADDGNASNASCNFSTASGYYCLTNLQ